MKIRAFLTGMIVICISATAAFAGDAVDALNLGLSKTSVFDTPSPEPFQYNKAKPGKSDYIPRAYPGAPPQIPHRVSDSLPITADENLCLDCHDNPRKWGQKIKQGKAGPIPKSHYTDMRSGNKVGKKLVGARFFCTQCHAPQARVEPLVENRLPSVSK